MSILFKHPRFLIPILCCVFGLAFLHLSCKKHFQSANQVTSEIAQARDWFKKEVIDKEKQSMLTTSSTSPGGTRIPVFARMGGLGTLLAWSQAKEYNADGFKYIVVPVEEGLTSLSNPNFESLRGAVFYKENYAMRMMVVEVLSEKGGRLNAGFYQIASTAFTNKHFHQRKPIGRMNGQVLFYDDHYKYNGTYRVIFGNWSKGNFKLENQKGATVRKRIAGTLMQSTSCSVCTTWYTIGYWFDIQTGEIVDSEIVDQYEDCSGTWAPDPGYGESPERAREEDCDVTAPTQLEKLRAGAVVSNDIESIATTAETAETRTKKYKWTILKNLTWRISSWENGVHTRVNNPNPDLQWQWQSLEHEGIAKEGIVLGGSVEEKSIIAIATRGLYHATMDIDFQVVFSVLCKGSPISFPQTYNSQRAFHVND